jgi:lipopolysaccharide heptosyltransferase II
VGRWLSAAEQYGRTVLLHVVSRLHRATHAVARDVLTAGPTCTLFICEDAIGDLILALGAIRAIAEAHPGSCVDVLTSEYTVDVLREVPYVRRIISFPRHDRRRVAAARAVRRFGPYDLVVDGMVMRSHVRTRSIAAMIGSGAALWIGEGDRPNDVVYDIAVSRPRDVLAIHHAARMMRLAEPLLPSGASRSLRPFLVVTAAERDSAHWTWADAGRGGASILVNVSAHGIQRRWPEERYAAVLRHIRQRVSDADIVVVGMRATMPMVHRLALTADAVPCCPTVRELIALVATSDLVVSPDTSVCHMASAFRRPIVSFTLRDKEQWVPYDTPSMVVHGTRLDSLDDVSADAVKRAFDEMLATAFRAPQRISPPAA